MPLRGSPVLRGSGAGSRGTRLAAATPPGPRTWALGEWAAARGLARGAQGSRGGRCPGVGTGQLQGPEGTSQVSRGGEGSSVWNAGDHTEGLEPTVVRVPRNPAFRGLWGDGLWGGQAVPGRPQKAQARGCGSPILPPSPSSGRRPTPTTGQGVQLGFVCGVRSFILKDRPPRPTTPFPLAASRSSTLNI